MPGRKKKPAAIKKLTGNAGKRKRTVDPQIDTSIPIAPPHLDAEALAEWERLTAMMANANMITPVYRALLASYCQTWSEWIALTNELEGQERWKTTPKGYEYENPRYIRVAKLRQELDGKCEKLGITPVSLSKVHITSANQKKQTKEQALAERLFQAMVK